MTKIKPYLIGLIGSLIITLILGMIFSLVLMYFNISDGLLTTVTLLINTVSVFTGGYLTARYSKGRGVLSGAITGIVYFVILIIAGLIMQSNKITFITPIKFVVCLVFGALGGIVGINRKMKRKMKI